MWRSRGTVSGVKSDLDYPDSLGQEETDQIIKNMNINEEQNCFKKATFNRETTLTNRFGNNLFYCMS